MLTTEIRATTSDNPPHRKGKTKVCLPDVAIHLEFSREEYLHRPRPEEQERLEELLREAKLKFRGMTALGITVVVPARTAWHMLSQLNLDFAEVAEFARERVEDIADNIRRSRKT